MSGADVSLDEVNIISNGIKHIDNPGIRSMNEKNISIKYIYIKQQRRIASL